MLARSPEEICRLFQQYMAEGDIDAVLGIYDAEAVFLNQSGEVKKGVEGLRQELAPFAANKAIFDFNIKQVIQSGDIALMHTEWKVSSPQQMSVVCGRGRPPSARRHVALAHRRSLYRRQTGCLLKRLPNNRLKPHIQPTWLVRSTAMRLDLIFWWSTRKSELYPLFFHRNCQFFYVIFQSRSKFALSPLGFHRSLTD